MPRQSRIGSNADWQALEGVNADYLDVELWHAAEKSIDYSGQPIEAMCLGQVGSNFTLSDASFGGLKPKIYSYNKTYNGDPTVLAELAILESPNIQTPVELTDFYVTVANDFVPAMRTNAASDGSTIKRIRVYTPPSATSLDAWTPLGDQSNTTVENVEIEGGLFGVDFGYLAVLNFTNLTIVDTTSQGTDTSGTNGTFYNTFSIGSPNADFEAGTLTVNCASGDATGDTGLTGRTTADFVNYANGDYRIALSSALHDLNIGAFFEPSGGNVADVAFTIPAPTFNASASATLPNPTADVAFTIPAPTFNASASVSGLELEPGDVVVINEQSNIIKLPFQSNIIKL